MNPFQWIVYFTLKQEDISRPKKPLGKTRETDNEVRRSKEAEMKRKFNRNKKEAHNSRRHPAKLSNILCVSNNNNEKSYDTFNICNPDHNISKLYNVLGQVRSVTSKMKLDI